MAYQIPKGRADERRRWYYARPQLKGGPTIFVTCPHCGRDIRVNFIDPDGAVRSALFCSSSDCDFGETNAVLLGYRPDGPFR